MLKPELFTVASNRLFHRCDAAHLLVLPVIYFIYSFFLFESKLKTLLYLFYRDNSKCGLTFSPKALGLLDLLLIYLHAKQKSEKKLVLLVMLWCWLTMDSFFFSFFYQVLSARHHLEHDWSSFRWNQHYWWKYEWRLRKRVCKRSLLSLKEDTTGKNTAVYIFNDFRLFCFQKCLISE